MIKKYLKLIKRIDERHYWPLFIFLSCYFVIPYSEFVVTALIILYFKFEGQFRRWGARLVKPFPEWLRIGGYWYPRGGIPIDIFWQTCKQPNDLFIPDHLVPNYRGRG